jgi:hypothetical protein
MTRLASIVALLLWFAGGILLGLIEIIKLPTDPLYSTLLQLLPLLLLAGGISFVISQYQKLGLNHDKASSRLRKIMIVGWFAVFGIDAGVASLNNMAVQIFHTQLPYYFQGVSLTQKIVALTGLFLLGLASGLSLWRHQEPPVQRSGRTPSDFWEKPLTNIGFIALALGVVLGLAQYWSTVIFAGFLLLIAGAMLYPVGRLTEKDIGFLDDETGNKS